MRRGEPASISTLWPTQIFKVIDVYLSFCAANIQKIRISIVARSNRTWLADLATEMKRPANDVIRELLTTYSTQRAAEIINVSHHTLRRHCERAGIPLQRYKQSPDRKPVESVAINRRTRLLEVGGVSLPIAEWARRSGIARGTIRMRLELGWDGGRAVSERPGQPYKRAGCIR